MVAQRQRVWLAAAICLLAALAAVAYVAVTLNGNSAVGPEATQPSRLASSTDDLKDKPYVVFLQSDGDAYRRVSLAPLEPGSEVLGTNLVCQRVYYTQDRGLCLGGSNPFGGDATIFDSNFNVLKKLDFSGVPSRVRISPDGRYGSLTVFVSGHSYAEAGFSTRTAIVDMATGEFVIDNLEDLEVRSNGRRIQAIDFNFWGVTFDRDSDHFFATLGTGGKTYLIEGSVASRQAHVLKENVECPSLSPDGSRLVFKKRFTRGLLQQVEWRLYTLDLATMEEKPLNDDRHVDDQVEWLDDSHIVYYLKDEGPPATIRPDLWVASVDGTEQPRRLLTSAFSPAVVQRPAR